MTWLTRLRSTCIRVLARKYCLCGVCGLSGVVRGSAWCAGQRFAARSSQRVVRGSQCNRSQRKLGNKVKGKLCISSLMAEEKSAVIWP